MEGLNNNFDEVYLRLIKEAYSGTPEVNNRTKELIYSTWGQCFKWDMNYYPLLDSRKIYAQTAASEIAWQILGTKDINFIQKYTKIWNKFVNDNNEMETAYGYRWRKAFDVDQLDNIIKKLKKDPSSRQQILLAWDPRVDNVVPAKNVPCPYSCVVGIINNKLNLMLTLRSNDLVIGLPYDCFTYTLLGQILAKTLNVKVGELFYTIANGHVYNKHFFEFKKYKETLNTRRIRFNKYKFKQTMTLKEIKRAPHKYVKLVNAEMGRLKYNCRYKYNFDIIE